MFWKKNVKAQPEVKPIKKECTHTWKDFPWYLQTGYTYDDYHKRFQWSIIEPYVCIYCGERKNIILEDGHRDNISVKQAEQLVDTIMDTYHGHLQPRAIVEDQIHDFKLVDPSTLYYYEMLHKNTPRTEFSTPSSLRKSTPAESSGIITLKL